MRARGRRDAQPGRRHFSLGVRGVVTLEDRSCQSGSDGSRAWVPRLLSLAARASKLVGGGRQPEQSQLDSFEDRAAGSTNAETHASKLRLQSGEVHAVAPRTMDSG